MWNHRLVQMHRDPEMDPWVQVMECYYNKDGSVAGFAEACVGSEYPDKITSILQRMIDDITRNPNILQLDGAVGFKPSDEEHF